MTNILIVRKTEIKIGSLSIEGLIDKNANFLVGFPQICALFSIPQINASRDFKTLLGKDLVIFKCRVEGVEGAAMNAITLPDFEILIMKLDRVKNNQKAADFRDVLAGLSLHQLFCDAFGIEFNAEDRQQWLIARMESKALYRNMTDAIQRQLKAAGKEEKFYHYSNPADAINMGLFGKKSKQIREELGLKTGLNRDHFGRTAIRRLTAVQEMAGNYIDEGWEPVEAVKEVIKNTKFKKVNYSD